MRTAKRIALVLTGTAILITAMTTSGARADRAPADQDPVHRLSTSQRARPQSQPDRMDYVEAAKLKSLATAIGHHSAAPMVANAGRGAWMQSELAAVLDQNENAATAASGCDSDSFAVQQRNASDGGRGPVTDDSEKTSCRDDSAPKTHTRQVALGDLDLAEIPSPEPEPVVVKFEAVIRIDLAGLRW